MRVLIVEDERLLRDLLRARLRDAFPEIEIHEAETTADAIALLEAHPFDVVLCDLTLRGRNAMAVLDHARGMARRPPVLVLTAHPESEYAVRCIAAGARGYVTKDAPADEIIHAIRETAAGRSYMTPAAAGLLADHAASYGALAPGPPHHRLSNRELEVLGRLGHGHSVNRIAQDLALSPKTIHSHRENVLRKLGCESTAELVRYVMEHDLRP